MVEAFRMRGVDAPKFAVTTFSVHLRHYVSASGDYITALPESIMRFNTQFLGFKILPIELPMPQWPVGIVTLRNRTLNPAAQLFIECTRDVVKSMVAGPRSDKRPGHLS